MRSWSKAVGAGLGYFVGGPIGAVLGYMAGHKLRPKLRAQEGHLLIANLLGFTTLFLKASTAPSPEDTRETVRFISRLFQFDAEDEHMAGELLRRLLDVDLDIDAMARTFRNHSDANMRNRLLEILATLCLLIEGPLQERQLTLLHRIAEALDLTAAQWQAIRSRYRTTSPQLDPDCCYALLGLYPTVSLEETRTAYRRLAKKYHPDHLAHLDQISQRRHSERMTLINAAYETIKAGRGKRSY